jgi:hypothetical protein
VDGRVSSLLEPWVRATASSQDEQNRYHYVSSPETANFVYWVGKSEAGHITIQASKLAFNGENCCPAARDATQGTWLFLARLRAENAIKSASLETCRPHWPRVFFRLPIRTQSQLATS